MNLKSRATSPEDIEGYQELQNTLANKTLQDISEAEEIVREMYQPLYIPPETEAQIYDLFGTFYNKQEQLIDFITKYGDQIYDSLGEKQSAALNQNIHKQGELLQGREELIVSYNAQKLANELMFTNTISQELSTIQTTIDALDKLNITYLPGIKEILQQYIDEQRNLTY